MKKIKTNNLNKSLVDLNQELDITIKEFKIYNSRAGSAFEPSMNYKGIFSPSEGNDDDSDAEQQIDEIDYKGSTNSLDNSEWTDVKLFKPSCCSQMNKKQLKNVDDKEIATLFDKNENKQTISKQNSIQKPPMKKCLPCTPTTLPDKNIHTTNSVNSKRYCYTSPCKELLNKCAPAKPTKVREAYSYFDDQIREIDFVLVCHSEKLNRVPLLPFLENLQREGLQLEYAKCQAFSNTVFIKLHGPDVKLLAVAKERRLVLLMEHKPPLQERSTCRGMDTILTDPNPNHIEYSRAPHAISGEQPFFLTSAERALLTYDVLRVTPYGAKCFECGIGSLIQKKILLAAYPLHNGAWQWTETGPLRDRQLLNAYWGNMRVFYKRQPFLFLRRYLGHEIALYFERRGLYVKMLAMPLIFGVLSLLFGLGTLKRFWIHAICHDDRLICPHCDYSKPESCGFSNMKDYCGNQIIVYLLDNLLSNIFSIVMFLWGVTFVALLRRKEYHLKWQWQMKRAVQEPEKTSSELFKHSLMWRDLPPTNYTNCLRTTSILLIMVSLILLVLVGLGFFQLWLVSWLTETVEVKRDGKTIWMETSQTTRLHAAMLVSTIAALTIILLTKINCILSHWLTLKEGLGSYTEFEESYSSKMFILSSISHYTLPLYVAFFKGSYFTYPSQPGLFSSPFSFAAHLCEPTGCICELCILVSLIFLVKFFVNLILNIFMPILTTLYYTRRTKQYLNFQWEMDYLLSTINRHFVSNSQVEFVIQYGFIVFFVSGCPIIGLIAFILNLVELRLTAIKYMRRFRRPVPLQCYSSIFVSLLKYITYIGVMINICVFAFTSKCIPRVMFALLVNPRLVGYGKTVVSVRIWFVDCILCPVLFASVVFLETWIMAEREKYSDKITWDSD